MGASHETPPEVGDGALSDVGADGPADTALLQDAAEPTGDAASEASCPWCPPNCDPGAYEDAGTGPCAPRWIQGDGCFGGKVFFPCGLPSPSQTLGSCTPYCAGSPYFNTCNASDEAGNFVPFSQTADADGVPTNVSCAHTFTGRRPTRLVDEPSWNWRSVGDALAHFAYLEAASVPAFLELAEQLEAHGAPAALVSRARRAARDEVRHADIMGTIARARDGVLRPPHVTWGDACSLGEIAIHNASEGCVRETWGAACAIVQSQRADDREVRRAMAVIARDEVAHAALSWDIAYWISKRLTPEERSDVDEARTRAISRLKEELKQSMPEALRRALGLPSQTEAFAIVDRMSAEVWSAAA